VRLLFDWTPRKAESNLRKHGISFDEAMAVFADGNALTIFDEEHSDDEDRWITLGMGRSGNLLLVVHTHVDIGPDVAMIRIISARPATRREIAQYRDRRDT
jgi:uncharacterized DUF497 family protein